MSIEADTQADKAGHSSVDYAALRSEVTDTAPPKSPERLPLLADYQSSVANIQRSVYYFRRQQTGLSEAVASLKEVYVEDVSDPTMKLFNDVMIETIPAFRRERSIQRMKAENDEKFRRDTPRSELLSGSRKIAALVERSIEYDHELTDVIDVGRSNFERGHVVNWLNQMAGGTPETKKFASQTVNGVVSELAVLDSLSEGHVGFVQFGTVEQDLKGIDIEGYTDSNFPESTYFSVDVKTSTRGTNPYWRNGHPHLIVGVNPEELEGLNVDPRIRLKIRNSVTEGLSIARSQRASLGDYIPRRGERL